MLFFVFVSGSSCKLLYPAEESVEFVTGQIFIGQFVIWVLITQDVKHQLHQPMLKLRKIESLVVQVRNLLRTSQQHPQQEARCRYFCKQLEHMLMLRIVPSYYLFVYYLIAEAKDLTLQTIWRGNWVWYPIKTETLNLNTLGNEKFSKRDCNLIKLRLQGKHGEDVKYLH